jgi:antitoxin (DNA-binding transcriptional repressor) of toxin-antitoxin stability system
MSKTISLDELPRKAERLLRSVWEERESIILERNGEPVATVAPMKADGDRKKGKRKKEKGEHNG